MKYRDFLETKVTFARLMTATFVVRVGTVFVIGKLPCMEPNYLRVVEALTQSPERIAVQLAPTYGFLLAALGPIFRTSTVASGVLFVCFSTLLSGAGFLLAKRLFDELTAKIFAILLIFLPHFTVAIAGYSHSVVVGVALLWSAFYVNSSLLVGFAAGTGWQGKGRFAQVVATVLLYTLAIYIRPENAVLVFPMIFINGLVFGESLTNDTLKVSAGVAVALGLAIALHGVFIGQRNIESSAGLFADKSYSYITFLHTLSMRSSGRIDDDLAMDLGEAAFGRAEANGFSVPRAVLNNPAEFARNIVFNLQDVLATAAHPLFLPFFLYLFTGLGLVRMWRESKKPLAFLCCTGLLALPFLVLFHVEVRYMANLAMPMLIVSAFGLRSISEQAMRNTFLTLFVLGVLGIYSAYLVHHAAAESLCM